MGAIQQMFLCRGGLSAFRYYRMFITANNGDASFTNVAELQLRGTIGGPSLVPTLSGSDARILFSSFNVGNDPWRAFDNSSAGTPWITASGQALNSYIGWDFTVNTIVKEMAYATGAASVAARAPRDFRMEGSLDNVNWVTLNSDTGRTNTAGAFLSYATGL